MGFNYQLIIFDYVAKNVVAPFYQKCYWKHLKYTHGVCMKTGWL